jgi:hypothetical protein
MTKPLYVREVSNKMYSPAAYFLAAWLASTMNLLFYPVLCASINFWFLGFNDTSIYNFLNWVAIVVIVGVSGSSFGFMFGCILDNEQQGLLVTNLIFTVFQFGGGLFASLGPGANEVVKVIGWVSPFRYACEKMLRVMLNGLWYVNIPCDLLKYNNNDLCFPVLVSMALGFFLLSGASYLIKARSI